MNKIYPKDAENGKWIPINEAVPATDEDVIVTCFREWSAQDYLDGSLGTYPLDVVVAYLADDDNKWYRPERGEQEQVGTVFAWMPLPKNFEPDKDDVFAAMSVKALLEEEAE